MSWHPNDLVTDTDLEAYESNILTQFNKTDWLGRRAKAIEDWLKPLLEQRKFDPDRLRTRHTPVSAFGYTSSTYSDKTTAAATEDGLNLATILASSSDALYLGFAQPFRGVLISMLDAVNTTVDLTFTVKAWTGAWTTVDDLSDGTRIGTKSAAQGGSLTWTLPEGVIRRAVNASDPLYWVRLSASSAPTGATAGPLAVIRRSRLAAPVTLRTLALIYREAPVGQDGPWREKADWYEAEADKAFLRVAEALGPEFDTDDSDAIGPTEETQTAATVTGGGWTFERS